MIGNVSDLNKCDTSAIIFLLETSNEYLLTDLGEKCEQAAAKIVSLENIGKFMLLCARYKSAFLISVRFSPRVVIYGFMGVTRLKPRHI
jgi:hypothetical protein